jgi:SP family facilitated glucose transporter-like MFS transporter 1
MSLAGAHTPHVSTTNHFSPTLDLSKCFESEERAIITQEGVKEKRLDEGTPLLRENARTKVHVDTTINTTLLMTIIVVTIGSSFQFGYGTGILNNSEAFIVQYYEARGKTYSLVAWGTTVSCFGIGGLVGSVLGPKVIGRYCGRRTTLLVNNIFLVISSVLMVSAPVWWYQAISRVFMGITAGVATAVVPTYLTEISPVSVRGAVGTSHQVGVTVGILVAQVLSTPSLNLLGSEDRWQWLFLVPVLCGLVEVVVLPFCPESPSYLYSTVGKEAARRALVRLQCEEVADQYLEFIREEVESSADSTGVVNKNGITVRELFADLTLRKQLIVGITVQLMMQFSGIDAVLYYSTKVFYQAEVSDPELATTCLGAINVVVTIFALKWMDTAGRKTLLTYSLIGMFCSYFLLTTSFALKPYLSYMDQLTVAATTGVIVCFAFGPGCIAWFIIAE